MKVYEYSWWWREILRGDHPWFWMFIKPDVNPRETTYQAYSLNCWVVFTTGPGFWTDHQQQEHGGMEEPYLSGSSFCGPKRRPPHDILCSCRHQMTSGEELVVKSRKAVGVAVAMQIRVEVLAAIARKHILRGNQIWTKGRKQGPVVRHAYMSISVMKFLWTSKVARTKSTNRNHRQHWHNLHNHQIIPYNLLCHSPMNIHPNIAMSIFIPVLPFRPKNPQKKHA